MRTISVMIPWRSFSWRAVTQYIYQTLVREIELEKGLLPIGERLPYVNIANLIDTVRLQ